MLRASNLCVTIAVVVFAVLQCCRAQQLAASETQALLSLINAIPGLQGPAGSDFLRPWNASNIFSACSWSGITCDSEGRVTMIYLQSINAISTTGGTIPNQIQSLERLTYLGLYNLRLSGTIPEGIGFLPNLEGIVLGLNRLEGTIPFSYGLLRKLQTLDLSSNRFISGTVPSSFAALSQMRELYLDDNKLTGSLNWLGGMPLLRQLRLSSNQFEGELPNLRGYDLNTLLLSDNRFSGTIPDWLRDMKSLSRLHLGGNPIFGTIPDIFQNLTNLGDIGMESMQLVGTIPPSLASIFPFRIDLSNNFLSGTIPNLYFGIMLLNNNTLGGCFNERLFPGSRIFCDVEQRYPALCHCMGSNVTRFCNISRCPYCESNFTCVNALLPAGAPCVNSSQCVTGLCSDSGECCTTPCAGPCQSCRNGTCLTTSGPTDRCSIVPCKNTAAGFMDTQCTRFPIGSIGHFTRYILSLADLFRHADLGPQCRQGNCIDISACPSDVSRSLPRVISQSLSCGSLQCIRESSCIAGRYIENATIDDVCFTSIGSGSCPELDTCSSNGTCLPFRLIAPPNLQPTAQCYALLCPWEWAWTDATAGVAALGSLVIPIIAFIVLARKCGANLVIETKQKPNPPDASENGVPTIGVGLSGGGIRSASFATGFMQALAKKNVLNDDRQVRLASVSGGGFTAGSIMSHLDTPNASIKEAIKSVVDRFSEAPDYLITSDTSLGEGRILKCFACCGFNLWILGVSYLAFVGSLISFVVWWISQFTSQMAGIAALVLFIFFCVLNGVVFGLSFWTRRHQTDYKSYGPMYKCIKTRALVQLVDVAALAGTILLYLLLLVVCFLPIVVLPVPILVGFGFVTGLLVPVDGRVGRPELAASLDKWWIIVIVQLISLLLFVANLVLKFKKCPRAAAVSFVCCLFTLVISFSYIGIFGEKLLKQTAALSPDSSTAESASIGTSATLLALFYGGARTAINKAFKKVFANAFTTTLASTVMARVALWHIGETSKPLIFSTPYSPRAWWSLMLFAVIAGLLLPLTWHWKQSVLFYYWRWRIGRLFKTPDHSIFNHENRIMWLPTTTAHHVNFENNCNLLYFKQTKSSADSQASKVDKEILPVFCPMISKTKKPVERGEGDKFVSESLKTYHLHEGSRCLVENKLTRSANGDLEWAIGDQALQLEHINPRYEVWKLNARTVAAFSASAIGYNMGELGIGMPQEQTFFGAGLGGWISLERQDLSTWLVWLVIVIVFQVAPILGFTLPQLLSSSLGVVETTRRYSLAFGGGAVAITLTYIMLGVFYPTKFLFAPIVRSLYNALNIPWTLESLPPYVYVSDGGHYENLAMLPLLQERCDTIFISDGEYDDKWTGAALLRAVSLAQKHLFVEFSGPKGEDPISYIQFWIQRHEEHALERPASEERTKRVLHLKVKYHRRAGETTNKTGNLFYVKLPEESSTHKDDRAHGGACCPGCLGCLCTPPQDSTGNQFFWPEKFDHYRGIGYELGQNAADRFFSSATTTIHANDVQEPPVREIDSTKVSKKKKSSKRALNKSKGPVETSEISQQPSSSTTSPDLPPPLTLPNEI